MTTYVNINCGQGTETIDEISRNEYPTMRAYRAARRQLLQDYLMSYRRSDVKVWLSQRATKEWRNS